MLQHLSGLGFAFAVAAWASGVGPALAQSPGIFTSAGNMKSARYAHTATLLGDGSVLIAGGFGSGVEAQASAELYDPTSGTFSATGDMTAPRANHKAVLLPDGRVLIVGGQLTIFGGNGPPAGVEVYDPSKGTFTQVGNLGAYVITVTVLPNGQVLFTVQVPLNAAADAKLYDPVTGALTPAANNVPPRLGTSATLLPNGQVLFNNAGLAALNPVNLGGGQLYDPATRTFRPTGDDIYYDTAAVLLNGDVLLIRTDESSTLAFLYHPTTGTLTPAAMPKAPASSATLLASGAVLLLNNSRNGSTELYDPGTDSFSSAGVMVLPRFSATATLLKSGQVLLTGGFLLPETGPPGPPLPAVASAELYTPPALVPAPVLFSLSGDGIGQGAIWHAATGQIVSPGSPATAGEALSLYTTGLTAGGAIPPEVAIGGRLGEILYFGEAPGFAGFNQVNVRLPEGVAFGSAVPVRLTYLGRPSNTVTIAVH